MTKIAKFAVVIKSAESNAFNRCVIQMAMLHKEMYLNLAFYISRCIRLVACPINSNLDKSCGSTSTA